MWKNLAKTVCVRYTESYSNKTANNNYNNYLLGASLRVLYRYTEVIPKNTNHDKMDKYLTNTVARKKFKFAATSEVTSVS